MMKIMKIMKIMKRRKKTRNKATLGDGVILSPSLFYIKATTKPRSFRCGDKSHLYPSI